MLPMKYPDGVEQMSHLRLHNGTIWRWNRPLIGFDYDGRPHLRIEHRVVPGGPSIVDVIANAALFFGMMQGLSMQDISPEQQLDFPMARDNFYAAAHHGLGASLTWLDGRRGSAQALLKDVLIPLARRGLEGLEMDRADIDRYLGIIEARVGSGRTGAAWQRAWVARHGKDMAAMTSDYGRHQESGLPVHEWPI